MSHTDLELQALVRKAKKDKKRIVVSDGGGLTLVIQPTGTAAWKLRYYFGKVQKEYPVGRYPDVTGSAARKAAEKLRVRVSEGEDVLAALRRPVIEAEPQGMTLDALAADYFEKAKGRMHPHTFKQRQSIHARFVSPVIGGRVASLIQPKALSDLVAATLPTGKTLPKTTLVHLGAVFAHGVGNGALATNPCRDLELVAIVGEPPEIRQRIAFDDVELSHFLRALPRLPRNYELVVRLMLLTGVRVSQITEAKRGEFDFEAGRWAIPRERRKNRRYTSGPFVIPLPERALGWVKELMRIADTGDYLLPVEYRRNSDGRNPLSKRGAVGDWLDRMWRGHGNQWRRVTPHDLRANCKSWLKTIKVEFDVRQKYLDHSLKGMDGVYDKAELFEERLEAANRWLATMDRLEASGGADAGGEVQGRAE